jgi:transketolase
MRQTCVNMVHELAKSDPRVVFIGSDLSPGLLGKMKQDMPDRHFMEGVMEQHVIGMAAGMAMDGMIPYVNTIATFITRRCYEQVALDLCLHDLPVRLIANGGGVVYAPLGPTHLAVEDFAIMRALPNMTVTAVSDAEEMKRLMPATLDWPHPIYIRLGKGGDPVISDPAHGFAIGKGIVLRKAKDKGHPLLISCGVMTGRALDAAKLLSAQGVEAEVLHIHTLKPLDDALVLERVEKAGSVFTIEEHTKIGGLGSAVSELLDEQGGKSRPVVHRLALKDKFQVNYGLQEDLLALSGLSPEGIAASVMRVARG